MISCLKKLSPYVRIVKKYTSSGSPAGFIDPDCVFTLILNGGGTFVLEGVEHQVRRGDLIFFPPYMHHLIKPATPIEQLIIHFDPIHDITREGRDIYRNPEYHSLKDFLETTPEPIIKQLAKQPSVISFSEETFSTLRNQITTGLELHQNSSDFSDIFLKGVVTEIIYHLHTGVEQSPDRNSFDTKKWAKLEEVTAHIHKNYNRTISLEDAAAIAGVARTYFSRIFKEYMGINFHNYIMNLRIERAKSMMEDDDFNFTEIAEITGFANIHHFSKIFKKIEGCSPTQYKKSVHIKLFY